MNAPTLLALYNQTIQTDEDFLSGFVARGDVADFLARQLRLPEPQPQLLVGGRGMGKTSLLRRAAISVAQEEELRARYVPLRFREEQYNVLTLADFWRNCAESLAEWCETNRPASGFPALFDRCVASPQWRDAETVYEAFIAEAHALGLRPLLLVDNLDLVISNLSDQENWALRRALQAPDGPALIAASTHAPEQLGDRDAAFYEFFRVHLLTPLSADELIGCLRALALKRGEEGRPALEVAEKEPQRVRALHAFTGGNPRVLALVYKLLASQSTHEALADLEALLDVLTPYYKGRVEEYQTKLQRAVIDALALNWDPISARQLADATNTEVTTISSQLTRLRNDGLIEEVELSGARAGFQMVERLFNIWYLMRHGTRRTRNRVTWLTKFLVTFYPEEELRRIAAGYAAVGAATRESEYYREALAGAMEALEAGAGGAGDAEAAALWEESVAENEAGRFEAVLDAVLRLRSLSEARGASARLWLARAMIGQGYALGKLGRTDEAIAVYGNVFARFADDREPAIRDMAAMALYNKGVRLGDIGRSEEAISVYDDVLARFGNDREPAMRERVAKALYNKGFRLGMIGRADEAIAVYDDVLARFGDDPEPAVRERVAGALVDKGYRLGEIGRSEEQIAVYNDLLARFGDDRETAVREQVAIALFDKGVRLGEIGRSEEEIAVYDDVLARFADDREPAVREMVAKALFNKGVRLGEIGRAEEAMAVYDDVLARFGNDCEPAVREQVAKALENKGYELAEDYGRFAEAAETIRRARALIASNRPEFVAFNLAWAALASGDPAEGAALREKLEPSLRRELLDAGLAFAADNFGAATQALDRALADPDLGGQFDLLRLLRLAHMRGYGEKLIAHFESAGHAERLAPVHAALLALERGERQLLNVNPETRGPAETIFRRLVAPLRAAAPPPKPATRRGRPPKRRRR